MKKIPKRYLLYFGASLVCTVLLLYPYLVKDLLAIEHDTFFHLSRIEGMAMSMKNGEYLPSVYPLKNNGYGYASPLFYSDVLLMPAALLYTFGVSIAFCYKFTVFVFTLISLFMTALYADRVTGNMPAACIALTAFAFANYRITDIYVRGALGEISAMMFLPVLLYGLYAVLYDSDAKGRMFVGAGLAGLVLSHNISFLFGVILTVIFFLLRAPGADPKDIRSLFEGILGAFFATAFFTLPMIEQLFSQRFNLNITGSDLAAYTMKPWQYITNRTVFGYGNNDYARDMIMTVNPGWFLTAAPLLMRKKNTSGQQAAFLRDVRILGYVFLLLPCSLLPWQNMHFASIIQFPWRLVMPAMALLCVPAAMAMTQISGRAVFAAAVSLVLAAEGIWHVTPALTRTFGITSQTPYSALIDGTLIDPYYSAYYVRTELAGGDYLPLGSPDFREREPVIYTEDGPLDTELRRLSTSILFTLDDAHDFVELPITYYKGYTIWKRDDIAGSYVTLPVIPSSSRLVSIRTAEPGQYMCIYQRTGVQLFARQASILTMVFLYLGKNRYFLKRLGFTFGAKK